MKRSGWVMRTIMAKSRLVLLVLLALFSLGRVGHVTADEPGSHFRYGTLSWAPTSNPGEVKFSLKAGFRRSSNFCPPPCTASLMGTIITETQGPTLFNFGDGNFTGTLLFLITAESVAEDWVIGEALNPSTTNIGILHTYSGAGPFTAYLSQNGVSPGCCRIGQAGFTGTPALNNSAGGTYPLQTTVFPQSVNSSPVSTQVPIVVVPQSTTATFTVPASDPNGDNIQFRLATSAEAGSGTPLHPPGLSVNATTGQVTWNNLTSGTMGAALDMTNFWTTQIVIEDLDSGGIVKTKTPVDFLLKIVQQVGNPPSCSINPTGPLTVSVGSPVSFTVTGTDPDAGATVTLNSGGLPSGATMSPALPSLDL